MEKIEKDKELLEGFIWKPKDRPLSKESIIPSMYQAPPKKALVSKPVPKTTAPKKKLKKN
jgi:hypothetical protein